MSILIDKNTRVIVQGFTGKEASFHSEKMIEYGTNIVGGVTPGKGGIKHLNKPVFNNLENAQKELQANASIIFVPANFAAESIIESIDEEIPLTVVITEGIPLKDMILVKAHSKGKNTTIIGPNCPGIITPEECKLGIIPGEIFSKGTVGIISKSGTLTYEASYQVKKQGLGVSTAIGVGGDSILGTSIKKCVEMFMDDPNTESILIIGEIGGNLEIEAAKWIKNTGNKKPVAGFIAGETAPKGRQMGHAGAIIGGENDTASEKKKIMRECGIYVADSPSDIGKKVAESIKLN